MTGIRNDDVIRQPSFEDVLPCLNKFFHNCQNLIFTGHNVLFDYKFVKESYRRCRNKNDIQFSTLCTAKLARRLCRKLKSKSLGNLCEHFSIKQKHKHRALDDAFATAKLLLIFLEQLNSDYEFESVDEILKFQNTRIYTEEKKNPALKRIGIKLKDIPKSPGVYKFYNKNDELLYIGKAKSLRDRLSSYFRHTAEISYKLEKLLKYVTKLEYELTGSELSALILESKLIKQEKPRFNSALKRHRYQPYLKIDVQNGYPKIEKVYEIENDGANYYGPFSSGLTVNRILKEVDEKFNLRKCEYKILKPSQNHSTCMYYEMNRCKAPCNFTQTKTDYDKEVDRVHNYICSSKSYSIEKVYEKLMHVLAEKNEFERAAFMRDRLNDVKRVMSYQRVITSAINDKKIIIKMDSESKREFFFIHNGKLMNTFTVAKSDESQVNFVEQLTETSDYLFFSLSKYIKHKFTQFELDEIKVISNFLAQNRDRNVVMEINEDHSMNDIMKFISN